jgi:hypothetical protein
MCFPAGTVWAYPDLSCAYNVGDRIQGMRAAHLDVIIPPLVSERGTGPDSNILGDSVQQKEHNAKYDTLVLSKGEE